MITVEGLWKRFRLYRDRHQSLKARLVSRRRSKYEEFWALKDVSFEVTPGESLGIIGANGCGKSTLLKCLTGIYKPTQGALTVDGRVSALIELGAGFHPELSGRENIFLNSSILGLDQNTIKSRFDQIVEFAGLEDFIESPVKVYSSGMTVRLGFAIAANADPEVLLVDEVLAVGDEAFQQKCFEHLAKFKRQGGTIVLVSHSLEQVRQVCDRAIWLDEGSIRTIGTPSEAIDQYLAEVHSAEIDESGRARWGTGEVWVEDVEVVDETGQQAAFIRSGRPFGIKARIKANQPVDDLVVGLRLDTVEGTRVWSTNTALKGIKTIAVAGSTLVTFLSEEMPLLGGQFELTVALADESLVNRYDQWERCKTIDVLPTEISDLHLVRLDGKFKIEDS